MLAIMKLGAVIMPTTTAVGPSDLADRITRGGARYVLCNPVDAAKLEHVAGDYTCSPREQLHDAYALDVPPAAHPGTAPRRPAAALLHLRHHLEAQAGRAHAGVLPRRPPRDDVLARPAARRRAPEHLLARLGEARLVLLLRAVDRGGDDLPLQLRPLRRGRAARPAARARGDVVLRAADGVADADHVRPLRRPGHAARGDRRRRAAQPRGDRAGAGRVGPDDPRRLRPDRDQRAGRQHRRRPGQARLDGQAAARPAGRAGRPADRRRWSRASARARSASTCRRTRCR